MFTVFQNIFLYIALAGLAVALMLLAVRSETLRVVQARLLALWGVLTPSGRVISVSLLAMSILYGGGKTNSLPRMMTRSSTPTQLTYAQKKAENWNIRGAWKDSFWLKFADGWHFPCGTNHLRGVEVISYGELWQTAFGNNAVASIGAPVEIVPTLSSFLYEFTPSNSYRFVWETAAINRDANNLISASLELFRNGDACIVTNGVATYKDRVLPSEWGNSSEDGFYGNDNTLPSGADEGAYYWIDLVVSNATAKVKFVGEGESNYSDPDFVAKENSTNRVVLLIGKPYTVTCDEAIGIIAKSDEDINVEHISENEIKIVWPLQFDVSHETMYATPRTTTTVPVQGGFIIETFPLLTGVYTWETNKCCDFKSESLGKLWRFSCQDDCYCTGCSFEGVFVYEGYRHPVVDLSCGCTHKEEPSATASISFSKSAVIFENCYTNSPNDIMPRRSTTNSLNITVYGGPFGGIAEIDFDDKGKLEYLTQEAIPRAVSVAAEQTLELSFPFIAKEESASENDIKASLKFTEYFTGDVFESEDEMTAVRVEITPWVTKEGCVNRHLVGVREVILCVATPNVGQWKENGGGRFLFRDNYECPLTVEDSVLYYEINEDSYDLKLNVVEPERIVAISPVVKDFSVAENRAGGTGMNLNIYIYPLTVSFSRISMEEVPSLDGDFNGYFSNVFFSNVWYHTVQMGAGQWVNIRPDNFRGADRVWMGDVLPREMSNGEMTFDLHAGAWSSGTLIWKIPWGWQDSDAQIGDIPVKTIKIRYNQVFEIDQFGTLSVSKFGYVVSRGTNNVFRLNGNIVEPEPLTQEDYDAVN